MYGDTGAHGVGFRSGVVMVGGISDVNRKPKFWYNKKIPIPNWYLFFSALNLLVFSGYFIGYLNTIIIKFG